MTSIMFGTLNSIGVPADEKVVRNTATPVEHDAPAAMQEDMPEPNEVETDHNPHLGMDTRQLASKWVEGSHVQHDETRVAGQNVANQIINSQVSTSGTAAMREAAGMTHKNLSYAVGIEPVGDLVDGHKMSNEYFQRDARNVQATEVPSMTVPPGMGNPGLIENISSAGRENARIAAESSIYNAFWNGGAK